ncbi:E3 ubiquitin-protein ligase TRIM33-like isoform X3 [Xenia sp. Carnegie-2017]|uniref:E3 ubiquitin-protein ligase TRIM33-like isoform X3 n=1 Tax=Xenia sp. Carnegie-2017 TaxID=2897299 RepID=UPI001F03B551|nr:E3 ubiquitin-protein ligase TRIM33-like isoform X3 [Xenia sp. Carnegie-2017]
MNVIETIEIDKEETAVAVEDSSLPKSCSICKTGFDSVAPKLLPCLHSFCQSCLEDRLRGNEPSTTSAVPCSARLKCPKCGQEFLVPARGVATLIDNQFILDIVKKPSRENESASHKCTSCEDDSDASSFCLNCSEWLCSACVQAHQRVRVTKDHEIKSGEELKESLRNNNRSERCLYCKKHPSEKLQLFCVKCERLTCRDCQLHEHKHHQYQFVNEAAARYREFFKKKLICLEEKLAPLAESIDSVKNSTTHLELKSEAVVNDIKNTSNDIISAVRERESVLLNELQALVQFKRKLLLKQTKDLNLMQAILKHNHEFTRHAVLNGSDASLLMTQRQLGSRIQNLLSLKYRVTPVAPSELKFVSESVKLCNVIAKTGSVMTQSNQRSNHLQARSTNPPAYQTAMKINPFPLLNNRPGLHTTMNPKPSSKVYPNVITSHIGMPLHGVQNSSMIHPSIAQAPNRTNPIPQTTWHVQHSPSNPQVPSYNSRHLMNTDVSTINSSRKAVDVSYLVRQPTSLPTQVSPSSPTINLNNMLSNILRRDNLPTPQARERSASAPSISTVNNQSSSPNLPRPSPDPSQSSSTPSPSPVLSSKTLVSPIQSPLPTFVESEIRESAGIKIKIEKSNLSPEYDCSVVKEEPDLASSLCSCSTGKEIVHVSSSPMNGPPSSNSSNDDWCAVCHNGGELLCCDTCPKVFHLNCHVPSLTSTPSDSWNCGLCESLDAPRKQHENAKRRAPVDGISERDAKRCEKMLLELFCHPDSTPFHDKVPNYYKVIQKPMDLTLIKTKLQPMHFEHYNSVNEFIADCKLVFSNCALFNDAESDVGKMGKRLAADFQNIVRKYSERDDDMEPAAKKKKENDI